MSPSLSYQPIVSTAPSTLIDHHGKLQLGLFDASIADLNVTAFRLHSVMDKPVSRLAQHFAYKQFQFVCISGPDWLLAVVRPGYGWLLVYGPVVLSPLGFVLGLWAGASGVARKRAMTAANGSRKDE